MRVLDNVVKLPGAAKRKPDNYRYAAQRKQMMAMRKETKNRFDHRHPGQREVMRLAKQLQAIKQTPALIVASAILRCLDDETYAKVLQQLAPGTASENEAAQQALATAQASRLTVGQQLDLFNAFDELRGEGRR